MKYLLDFIQFFLFILCPCIAEKPLSQKEEDLLSEVTYLRKQIPNDYKEKLARENIQYFKELVIRYTDY